MHAIASSFRLLVPGSPVRAQAGFPSPAEDHTEEPVDLLERLCPNRTASFLFVVAGSSMEGANVHDGDVCIVDRSLPHRDGRLVVAIVDGGFSVKQLRVRDGRLRLWSVPGNGPPTPLEGISEAQVWGVVRSTVTGHLGGALAGAETRLR